MIDLMWQLCKWMTTLSYHCCLLAKSCSTLCDPMDCSVAGFSVFHYLLEFVQTQVLLVMLSNHLILCRSLLLLPSIFSSIRVLSNELALHIRWPKYWSFSLSISPSNEYSGLISFRIDWFGLLAVWGTLRVFFIKKKITSLQQRIWNFSGVQDCTLWVFLADMERGRKCPVWEGLGLWKLSMT